MRQEVHNVRRGVYTVHSPSFPLYTAWWIDLLEIAVVLWFKVRYISCKES